jgi:hypothetical protein
MLYAWSGPSLLVVNTRGECAEDQRLSGYYFREARFVRTLRLRSNGHAPWPCEAASVSPDTLAFSYVHPEITEGGGGGTPTPGTYPRANTPQLWNATAFPLAIQALLGLLPLAPFNTLVVDPHLPRWMPDVILHDLRVGDARVTLRCWRTRDASSHFEVLSRHGTLHVVRRRRRRSPSRQVSSPAPARRSKPSCAR